MNRRTLLPILLLALAAPLEAQNLCPHTLTLREATGTAGVSQSPGSGLGGRITRAEFDQNLLNLDAVCAGTITAEEWGTSLADGCVLTASSGALVCGSAAGSHAATHVDGGADELDPALLTSAACLDGQVLAADATGGAWTCTTPATGGGDAIMDADGDTRIRVEASADEDTVRLEAGGVEVLTATSTGIAVTEISASSATEAENFGAGATAAGAQGTAVGSLANAGSNAVAIGHGSAAVSGGGYSVAVGGDASVGPSSVAIGQNANGAMGGTGNIAIGRGSSAGLGSICLGYSCTSTSQQFVVGSGSAPIVDVYFGEGATNSSPVAVTVHATGALGTDLAGADLELAGGIGTGTGGGGSVVLQAAPAGGTGSAPNSLTTILEATPAGVTLHGTTTIEDVLDLPALTTAPAANAGRIYHDDSGALCWYDGTGWVVVAGSGSCA